MTESEFGDRLRTYRKSKNMTQQELAERLGVSDKSVSRWENGSYPDVPLLGPLAKELGVTVDDLLGTAPPLRKLERSDLQNWLSFGFAIGGGIVFFVLNLFLPGLLCYAAYLGLMAYGVYLQKNYTFHNKWFHVGNLVMNFFVNLELAGWILSTLLVLDGMSLTEDAFDRILYIIASRSIGTRYMLLAAVGPCIAAALTAATGLLIRRWWQGEVRPLRPGFSPKNLTPARVLPALCPLAPALYLALFAGETRLLPVWVYRHQGGILCALIAGLTVLCVLLLVLRRQKGMLVPFAAMQLMSLYLPRLCRFDRAIGTGTGKLYDAAGLSDNYIRFAEAGAPVFVLAALLCAVYLLCCFVKVWDSPPEVQNSGKSAPM